MAPTTRQALAALSDTVKLTVLVTYDKADKTGVSIIIACAALSLISVVILFGFLALSFWQKRSAANNHFFVRSHAAPYFICLLLSVLVQVIGSLMNAEWTNNNGIHFGSFCSSQGAIKNAGNLGISLWTLVLGIYTFVILFLRWNPRDWALYSTVFGVWVLIGFLVLIGPAAAQRADKGPYFSIAGLWCWIADPYNVEKVMLEYFWMLGAAFISFILYTLTFLRLRGNIYVESGRMKFRRIDSKNSWKYLAGRDVIDLELTRVAKGMIGFPIVFTVVVFPIAICRFVEWSGKNVALAPTIFAAALFNLSGVFYLILFLTTRSLLPESGFFNTSKVAPRPKVTPAMIEHDGIQPYVVSDFSSAHGFSEMYQAEAEKGMSDVPARTQASLNPGGTHSRRPSISGPVIEELKFPEPIDTDMSSREYPRTSVIAASASEMTPWDDIDLGRQVAPVDDDFGRTHLNRPEGKERPSSVFSISAYGSEDGDRELKVEGAQGLHRSSSDTRL